ncbi:MAG: hypothetical protein O7G88_08590 [bacterium]|nr:hypothetical protein [bacterium]
MRRKRPPYPAEFRQQMIELVRAGRTPSPGVGSLCARASVRDPAVPRLGRAVAGRLVASVAGLTATCSVRSHPDGLSHEVTTLQRPRL